MKTMELIHADNLEPNQLMLGDLIKVDDDIVEDSDDDFQDKIFWDNYSSDYRTFINTYLNDEF